MFYSTINSISVSQGGSPILDDHIDISLEDEGGGLFLVISQTTDTADNAIRVGFDEWEHIARAVSVLKGQPLVK